MPGRTGDALRRLADGGNAHVMYRLPDVVSGRVPREAEGVRWFRRGADAGNVNAMTARGALMDGRGVAMDRQGSSRPLQAAAAENHVEAMNRLAHLLLDGTAVDKDTLEAAVADEGAESATRRR